MPERLKWGRGKRVTARLAAGPNDKFSECATVRRNRFVPQMRFCVDTVSIVAYIPGITEHRRNWLMRSRGRLPVRLEKKCPM